MEGIFDDIATADTQALITSSMNKNGASKELCNRAICNWVCINLQSFSVTGDLDFIKFIEALLKFAPPGYKPPLSHLVRGKCLNGAYEKSKLAGQGDSRRRAKAKGEGRVPNREISP
jgi:hypothetical protein